MAQTKSKAKPAAKKPAARPAEEVKTLFSVVVVWEMCDGAVEVDIRLTGLCLSDAQAFSIGFNQLANDDEVAFAVPQPLPKKFYSWALKGGAE